MIRHKTFPFKSAITAFVALAILAGSGCKKLVEVDPPVDKITESNVYKSDATAISVLTGIYKQLSSSGMLAQEFTVNTLALRAGLSADELTLWNGVNDRSLNAYYKNELSLTNAGGGFWFSSYNLIYTCNSAIEGLTSPQAINITKGVKQQLLGEAKFMRALFYFYLINFYGDVPLITATDYKTNAVLPRTSKDKVYQLIISDLEESIGLLSADYLDGTLVNPTTERTRPTKWAAEALLARVYLYTTDWVKAEQHASSVISNSTLFSLTNLNDVFVMNSLEAIWQLQPVSNGPTNTTDGYCFILPPEGPNDTRNPVFLSNSLLTKFENGDARRNLWIDSVETDNGTYRYPFKYKVNKLRADVTEYQMMFRLAELYLIRAEAKVQLQELTQGKSDLDIIRSRAELSPTSASSKEELVAAIEHERQVELFTESGHRWLDLKRTGKINDVMKIASAEKASTWSPYQQLYPLPPGEIINNGNLVQNPGY